MLRTLTFNKIEVSFKLLKGLAYVRRNRQVTDKIHKADKCSLTFHTTCFLNIQIFCTFSFEISHLFLRDFGLQSS